MRQKENLEQLLESLLLGGGEEQQYKQEHHSLPPLSLFSTMEAPASQPALLGPDIQEIKSLLIKVRSLLEKVRQDQNPHYLVIAAMPDND